MITHVLSRSLSSSNLQAQWMKVKHKEECGSSVYEGAEEILLWRTSRRCKLPWYLLRRVRGKGNDCSSGEQYSWRRGVVLSLLCDSNTTRKYTQLVTSGRDWSKFCCTSRILRNRHRRISSGSFWKQVRRDCEIWQQHSSLKLIWTEIQTTELWLR